LPEIDFDHDFGFDTDPERPWFESKSALDCDDMAHALSTRTIYRPCKQSPIPNTLEGLLLPPRQSPLPLSRKESHLTPQPLAWLGLLPYSASHG
jgi:hypothetical protein